MSHKGFFLVPAGILIGLGAGILLGYLVSGLIIGFGLGFLGSAASARPVPYGNPAHLWLLVIGVYIVVAGVVINWIPRTEWPDIAAVFLIIIGIWVVIRGYARR